ncbi:hypothetical protein ACPOL_2126 [Acidisarcina polymorpha]|uniref:Uncharacterized protein n=1 Tax=Acidisarcina polymorpha TaxID=2211140 RepID=A0A2Z5FXJ1_9BACT|nr:hypothetical protein ACPOL_2126 [Acidisarcina polymorpha]
MVLPFWLEKESIPLLPFHEREKSHGERAGVGVASIQPPTLAPLELKDG